MSLEANKAFVEKYIEAIRDDKSPSTLDKYTTDEDLKYHIALYESALPGYWIETDELVAEGDKVVLRGTVHGVHNGQLMNIPPTGKEVTVPLFITYRISDGKIVDHWMQADMLGLLQQVGAIPTPSEQ